MADAPARRPGLWVEIALALALITLATILLNAGVYWLLIKTTESGRRTDLAQGLSAAMVTHLETTATGPTLEPSAVRALVSAYGARGLELDALWVVDAAMEPVASPLGRPPATPDAGLREALYGRTAHTELYGELWGRRSVQVTQPIAPQGRVIGALRVGMPMKGTPVPGGPAAFVFGYTLFSGFAIALFGFSLFRNRLIAPVRKLQAGTDRIAAGEFGHMVRVDAAQELQDLSGALNTMSASLSGYRARTAEQLERLEAANQDLRQAQEALVRSEKLAGVGRMAAGLAHEIGNPLAAVLGYLELLQQGLDDPALERDLVARSNRELERIHRILQQLLGYARTGDAQRAAVSLPGAARDAVETVRHQPMLRDVALEVEVPAGLPRVGIEADRLQQVLVNLLLNAGDALQGNAHAAIMLRATGRDHDVCIEVLDNGHGFDAVAMDRAFEPFFTTREVGAGTGLGLSTCLEIVRAAGGTLEAANRPEGGARLELCLPIATVEDDPAAPVEGGGAGV
jgi:signal transduction histidine kinase